MRRRHLIILAKPPRMGRVKRRLAADIGEIEALRFYRQTLGATLRRLGRDPRWCCWLFVDDGAARWPVYFKRRRQGHGDLGERMDRALRTPFSGPVLLVGSDIPDISAQDIRAAFRCLAGCSAVFGPAEDGGYWLVGIAGRRAAPGLFRNVRWSSVHALADTIRNLPAGAHHALAAVRADVDDGPAYEKWRDRMASKIDDDWPSTGAVSVAR